MNEQEDKDFKTIKSFIGDKTRVADHLIEARFNTNGTFRVTINSENKEPARIIEIAKGLGAISGQYLPNDNKLILDFKSDQALLKLAAEKTRQDENTSPVVQKITERETLAQNLAKDPALMDYYRRP